MNKWKQIMSITSEISNNKVYVVFEFVRNVYEVKSVCNTRMKAHDFISTRPNSHFVVVEWVLNTFRDSY